MKEIEGRFGKRFIEITGGRMEINNVEGLIEDLEEIDKDNGTISQVFNAKKIAGLGHILQASKLALEALEEEKSFADSPKIELTCWTAGLRQINKALNKVGVTKGSKEIAVAIIGEKKKNVRNARASLFRELDIKESPEVIKMDEDKIKDLMGAFSISQDQLEVSSPEDIIKEKIALLSLKK